MDEINAHKGKETDVKSVQGLQHEVTICGMTMVGPNSEPFIKACIENHLPYVDEWVFQIDKIQDFSKTLKEYASKYDKIKVITLTCEAKNISGKGRVWTNEAKGRNNLKDDCDSDWVLMIDCDELYDEAFLKRMHKLATETNELGFFFRKINLWTSKNIYRVDKPWYPDIGGLKFFRNIPELNYYGIEHPTVWNNGMMVYETKETLLDEHIFHYNRIFPINPSKDGNFKTLNLDKIDIKELEMKQPSAAKYIKVKK